MRGPLPVLLIILSFAVALTGCDTTEQAREWQKIPHEKSELTIVSDVFDVARVKRKEALEYIGEVAHLTLNGVKVGFVGRQETYGDDSYCGYAQENIWNFFDGELVGKYLKNAGVPNRDDVKLQYRKNRHGNLYYLDAKGSNQRCMIVAELGGGGKTGICTGTYFIYGVICRNAYSTGVEELDHQVFNLMNDLSFIGNRKELIKRAKTAAVAKRSEGLGDYAYYTYEITDEIVCQLAIDQSEHTPKWGDNKYVPEAKRRGLTVADCFKYLNK